MGLSGSVNVIALLSKNWYAYTVSKNTQDRQWKYKHNIEARSFNQIDSGTATYITYPEWVFVALNIQHAKRIRHIIVCGLPGSKTFFHIIL
jgi:hypothetical protein